ncbi:dipeptidase [Spirochaetia bacterium]|nr:dipeptidase [Spirochaetia bacterium]
MRKIKLAALVLIMGLMGLDSLSPCTTTIVTRGASADGSVMVSHSDDGHLGADSSVIYVGRAPIDRTGSRAVYPSAVALDVMPEYNAFAIPRLATDEGAPGYRHPGVPRTIPIGSVPYSDILDFLGEANRSTTYAYLDCNYGIANEWGVMFGECTNGSKAIHNPAPDKRIFYSSELARVALENCKTARSAVLLMGHLIDTYGYWGTGETLPVADAEEAWVFEMAPVSEDYTKAGGLWAAQRVPDGEFFIAANEFRIREIDPAERNRTQLYGDNLFDVAHDLGWYTVTDKKSGLMDWLATVSLGEYSHPYYSLRRVWRGLSLAAPSLKLNPWVQDGQKGLTRDYPFSVRPDKKLTLGDIRDLHRDHYAGTEFDLTKGAAAGPWGNPNRYLGTNDSAGDVGDPDSELLGAWERPIGVYYTNVTYINQLRPDLPYPINIISWIALNAPSESVFVPFAIADMPPIYEIYDSGVYSPEGQAWQIYNLVGEYVNLRYNSMIRNINRAQKENEEASVRLVRELQQMLSPLAKENPEEALAQLKLVLNANALKIHRNWKLLFEDLVLSYNQGEVNLAPPGEQRRLGKTRYPDSWLEGTDYYRGPTTYKKKTGYDEEPAP